MSAWITTRVQRVSEDEFLKVLDSIERKGYDPRMLLREGPEIIIFSRYAEVPPPRGLKFNYGKVRD